MPQLYQDFATDQITIEIRQGAQVVRSAVVNGNTAWYDINGNMCRYVLASPRNGSGIDCTALPEHEAVVGLVDFFDNLNPKN